MVTRSTIKKFVIEGILKIMTYRHDNRSFPYSTEHRKNVAGTKKLHHTIRFLRAAAPTVYIYNGRLCMRVNSLHYLRPTLRLCMHLLDRLPVHNNAFIQARFIFIPFPRRARER